MTNNTTNDRAGHGTDLGATTLVGAGRGTTHEIKRDDQKKAKFFHKGRIHSTYCDALGSAKIQNK